MPPKTVVPSWNDLQRRRDKCRQPALLAAAELWWRTCRTVPAPAATDKGEEVLPREEYVRLGCCLYRAFVPVAWYEERAIEAALQDWCYDMGSEEASSITRGAFYSSLFELADAWATPSASGVTLDLAASAAQDAAWLDGLFETIARPLANKTGQPTSGFAWKEVNEIQCIVEAYREPEPAPAATPAASTKKRNRRSSRDSTRRGSVAPASADPAASPGRNSAGRR